MPICPAGHHSAATDFCDTCGVPLPAAAATPVPPPAATPLEPPAALVCPSCGTPNVAEALFCEACGHDFIGGTTPAPAVPAVPQTGPAPGTPYAGGTGHEEPGRNAPQHPGISESEQSPATFPSPSEASPAEPGEGSSETPRAQGVEELPSAPVEASQLEDPSQGPVGSPQVEWIAELWIDPDWYAAQGSTDPLPSPGLPDIVPLVKDTNLIGRISTSRNIYPEIDCELDTGCSRRHARLTTDGTRWWIEDLESANGTFLGTAAGPLPAMPIARGKVELAPDQRIYLGAWTRIVIRRATDDEKAAFAGLTT